MKEKKTKTNELISPQMVRNPLNYSTTGFVCMVR